MFDSHDLLPYPISWNLNPDKVPMVLMTPNLYRLRLWRHTLGGDRKVNMSLPLNLGSTFRCWNSVQIHADSEPPSGCAVSIYGGPRVGRKKRWPRKISFSARLILPTLLLQNKFW